MGNISDGPPQPPTHPWRLNPAIAPDVAQPGTASTPEDAEEGAPHGHAHAEARLHKLPWQMSVFCCPNLLVWLGSLFGAGNRTYQHGCVYITLYHRF